MGTPILGCDCKVCKSDNPKDKRLRSSAYIETEGLGILIDAGPDLRFQLLRENIVNVSVILLTHPHRDHIGGLDDIRPLNYRQHRPMAIYGSQTTLDGLRTILPYAFQENPYPGAPQMDLHCIDREKFMVEGVEIIPIKASHYFLNVRGYRIGSLCYLTDVKNIEPEEEEKLKGCEILVVNAIRKEPHISHFCLAEALDLIARIHPQKAYITHAGHDLGYEETSALLPENVFMAYDGLSFDF